MRISCISASSTSANYSPGILWINTRRCSLLCHTGWRDPWSASGQSFFRQAFRATDFGSSVDSFVYPMRWSTTPHFFQHSLALNKSILIGIQLSVECAVSVTALQNRDNTWLSSRTNGLVICGMYYWMSGWVIWSSCGHLGNLLRTKGTLNPTVLDIRYTFKINIF